MLKAKDLMSKVLKFVMPNESIETISQIMKDCDLGIVPVLDEEHNLLGVVTDRDIVIRNIAKKATGNNKKEMTAEDIMTRNVVTASPDDNIYDISKIMALKKIRRIPIVTNNKLVGIVSIADIAVTRKFDSEIAEAISEISK